MKSHFTRESVLMLFVILTLALQGCAPALADGEVLPVSVATAQMVKDWALVRGGEFVWLGPNGLQLYWRPLQQGVAWVIDQGGLLVSARLSPGVCSGNYCNFDTFGALLQSLKDSGAWARAAATGVWWRIAGKFFAAKVADYVYLKPIVIPSAPTPTITLTIMFFVNGTWLIEPPMMLDGGIQ